MSILFVDKMQLTCEICGRPIRGKKYKILIAGTVLTVCDSCKRYGTLVTTPKPPQPSLTKRRTRRLVRRPPSTPKLLDEVMVVEDYGNIIRRAREDMGWTQDFLAAQVGEKVSVIKRIEAGRMTPTLEMARKFEKILGVSLLTKISEIIPEPSSPPENELTLGDVIKIKKRKKGAEH